MFSEARLRERLTVTVLATVVVVRCLDIFTKKDNSRPNQRYLDFLNIFFLVHIYQNNPKLNFIHVSHLFIFLSFL